MAARPISRIAVGGGGERVQGPQLAGGQVAGGGQRGDHARSPAEHVHGPGEPADPSSGVDGGHDGPGRGTDESRGVAQHQSLAGQFVQERNLPGDEEDPAPAEHHGAAVSGTATGSHVDGQGHIHGRNVSLPVGNAARTSLAWPYSQRRG